MDYLLLTVLVFLASFFGSSLARLLQGEKKSDGTTAEPSIKINPLENINRMRKEKKAEKKSKIDEDTMQDWLYGIGKKGE